MTEQEKAVVQATPVVLQLSEQAIESTKHSIELCEHLVREVLERDIDYGTIPGVPQPFLWDSGAAKIMAAFNCYAEYKVIDADIQVPHIRYTISCQLINRQSQQVVATGIGAAYTKEIKHRYRWVTDPEKEGISRKGLKRKHDKYRVPNPDTEDLLNTIAKMAAKRADVDAAHSLPGVAATLRKLFQGTPLKAMKPTAPIPGPPQAEAETPPATEKPTWRWFAAKLQTLGVSHAQARDILGVNSIKDDWVGVQQRTLDEAYDRVKAAVMPPGDALQDEQEREAYIGPDEEPPEEESPEEALFAEPELEKPKRDAQTITTLNHLFKACSEDFKMQPFEVVRELGYSKAADIPTKTKTPADCYIEIAAVRAGGGS